MPRTYYARGRGYGFRVLFAESYELEAVILLKYRD